VQYAINTLQIELHKQLETIRVVKRYQAHPEYGGSSESYERDATVLQKAIAHLQSAEQGESPATDRQQLKAEIAAIATEFDTLGPGSCGGEHLKSFYDLVIKLRQLSAVAEQKCSCGKEATHHYCTKCYKYIQGVLNVCG
jgi:hypothetical protein